MVNFVRIRPRCTKAPKFVTKTDFSSLGLSIISHLRFTGRSHFIQWQHPLICMHIMGAAMTVIM